MHAEHRSSAAAQANQRGADWPVIGLILASTFALYAFCGFALYELVSAIA
jgi:hypothetical protein